LKSSNTRLDNISGKSDIDTYENYLSNLEEMKEHYSGFKNIAQVDMALWVLNEHINGNNPSKEMRDSFEKDQFIQKLRVKNMAHLLDLSDFSLACSLRDVNLRLSGQLAGFCFEQIVRRQYEKFIGKPSSDFDLKELIDDPKK